LDYVEHYGPILITLDKISNAFFQALQTTSKNYNSIKANVVELTMNHLKISVYNVNSLQSSTRSSSCMLNMGCPYRILFLCKFFVLCVIEKICNSFSEFIETIVMLDLVISLSLEHIQLIVALSNIQH